MFRCSSSMEPQHVNKQAVGTRGTCSESTFSNVQFRSFACSQVVPCWTRAVIMVACEWALLSSIAALLR